MNVCKQCGATFTDAERSTGRCAQCGTAIDGRATVVEAGPSATIEFVEPTVPTAPCKPPTVDEIRVEQTLEFAGPASPPVPIAPPVEAFKPGTVHPLPHLETIDLPAERSAADVANVSGKQLIPEASPPADLGATRDTTFEEGDLNRKLSMSWGAEVDSDAPPQMTLKGKPGQQTRVDQSLVINTRAVHDTRQLKSVPTLPDYELLEVLGEGGMGVVYTARQASIDRTVAIKMLKPKLANSRDSQQKFMSEAVVTGDLDHPNIVPMYDLGKNEAGDLFYAMKRVEGTPWSKAIAKKSRQENVEILLKAADAVAFAHARGVVHRDLKPENIMLGEFGEVLVMDWGLAYSTASFRKSASITHTHSMGGSPAYMAPEMAIGPIERVTTASDVYLLGAILYEIVTGRPPHGGSNVSQCLMSAARNEILPTAVTGELLDVALRAMATLPSDRYPSVRDFQAAVRDYLAHAESIALTARAEADLVKAQGGADYQTFARAVFGFEQAIGLWNGNGEALAGLTAAKYAYAECAFAKGDYDLAAGLLESNRPKHAALLTKIDAARVERDARQLRLRRAKRFVAAMVVGMFAIGTVAYFGIRTQRDRARQAEDVALKAEAQARQDRDLAVESKIAEEYAAYGARIGLAAARIEENAFDGAAELLDTCPPELRDWEWGRLKYLCERSLLTVNVGVPVLTAAFDPSGKRCVAGGWNGKLGVWNAAGGSLLLEIPYGGAFVNAAAFSPDGRYLAVGGSDEKAYVQLFDATTGKPLRAFVGKDGGHKGAVLSVAFDRSGARLLTTSQDGTARLWDAETGAELLPPFRGHSSAVWSAAFSPDETLIVTAGQDSTAVVWSIGRAATGAARNDESPAEVRAFLGHRGPVYDVAFSRDGRVVATAGEDRRVLLWNPADVRPYRLSEVFADPPPTPPASREFLGHATAVFGLAFSSDGRRLVSCGLDNSLIAWDVASGAALKTLRGHAGQVRACCFAPDDKLVLSGSQDGTLRLWDVDAYEEERAVKPLTLRGHADAVAAADFSPDEKSIVTAGRDRIAKLWDARTLSETATLAEGHEYLASAALFAGKGKWLITSAVDGSTRVWDVAAGVETTVVPDTGRSAAPAVSADGRRAVSADGGKRVRLWDVETGRTILALPEHNSEVTALAVSPDGARLFTGESSGRTNLWAVADGAQVWTALNHSRKITAAIFTADGTRLLTASLDDSIGCWDAASGRELTEQVWKHPAGVVGLTRVGSSRAVSVCEDGRVRLRDLAAENAPAEELPLPPGKYAAVAASDDGKRLAIVDRDAGLVRIWDVDARREIAGTDSSSKHRAWLEATTEGAIWSVVFAPDGESLVTVGANEARQWNLADGKQRQIFRPHGPVAGVAFSPDGRFVATSGGDGAVKIWDVATARAVRMLRGNHDRVVHCVAFSPDGTQLLTAGDDRLARLWNVETGEHLRDFAGHGDRVVSCAFSSDGKRIVTASADKTARLWDAEIGKTLHVLSGHVWAVLAAEFSRDGRFVVTSGADDVATIWNAETGAAVRSLTGHTAAVNAAAFSPDAARVVTASRDGKAKVWDVATGKELLTLKGHADEVTVAKFSKSGGTILTAGSDGAAILWPTVDWKARPSSPTSAAHAAKGAGAEPGDDAKVRKFTFHYRFRVKDLKPADGADKNLVRVWLPSPSDSDCQEIKRLPAATPAEIAEHREPRYGNGILYFAMPIPADGVFTVDVPYAVVRREVRRDVADFQGVPSEKLDEVKRTLYLGPNAMVPNSGKALDLLNSVELRPDKLGVARQLYDIVDEHVVYKKEGTGWGRGDVNWVCDSGFGNCTDFHSLFMSLARSQGLPARFEIGFSIPTDAEAGPIAGYHCWAWFHHDDRWIPVDISEADKHPELKEYYFGNLTADRVTFSEGRDLELVPKSASPPLNFFIYPHIEVAGRPLPKENVELQFSFQDE